MVARTDPYTATAWVNNSAPAINATNLLNIESAIDDIIDNGAELFGVITFDVAPVMQAGLEVSAATNGVLLSGAVTTCMSVQHVGSTAAHVIDMIDAYLGKVIETGSYASSADSGVTLTSTNARPVAFLFDDSGSALTGDIRAVLSRVYLSEDQDSAATINAIRGQIKVASDKDLDHANMVAAPITGYLELAGTANRTLTGHVACVRAAPEEGASGTTTISVSSYYAGFEATLNSTRSYTETGTMAGLIINISGGTSVWPNGIYIDAGAVTTGIDIGVCTTGLIMTGVTGYAIDIVTSGKFRMGVQGTGIPTVTATPFAVEIHSETGGDITSGGTGLTCGIRSRYEVSVAQTNQISFASIDSRLRVKADMDDGSHAGVRGTIEADTNAVFGGTATTQRSAGEFALDFSSGVTITSGWLAGVTIDSSVDGSISMASCTFVGLRVKAGSGKEAFEYGIYIDADSAAAAMLASTTLASQTAEGKYIDLTYSTDSTFLTGANVTYSGGRTSSMIKLTGTHSAVTGGLHGVYANITADVDTTTGGHGIVVYKGVVVSTDTGITDGERYGAQFIAKKAGSGISLAAASFIGCEGWFYETGSGEIRTGIGGNFGFHNDSSLGSHNAGSVHRGIQIFCDNGGTSNANESTGLCVWNMAGAVDNVLKVVESATGFTYFADLSQCNGNAGTTTSDSGSAATTWKARIKVKTDDGTDAWINVYETSNE